LDSAAVQGEGSFVELKAPGWGAARQFIMGGDAAGNEQERGLAMMEAMLPLCVVQWNWTGDDGQPLPLPADVDALTMDEVLYLVPHISAMLAPEKN
jgi:hypothetical protein